MMRASFEDAQHGAAVSEHAGTGLDRCARADSRNNQSEDRDALGASAWRRLFRERGAPQDSVRKMKIAKPIDIEFLQTERLQDFFTFHSRRPVYKVMNHPATTGGCRTVNYFCALSRYRNSERNEKLTDGKCARAGPGRYVRLTRLAQSAASARSARLAFDEREFGAFVERPRPLTYSVKLKGQGGPCNR
jgi:hypothetical protein